MATKQNKVALTFDASITARHNCTFYIVNTQEPEILGRLYFTV